MVAVPEKAGSQSDDAPSVTCSDPHIKKGEEGKRTEGARGTLALG